MKKLFLLGLFLFFSDLNFAQVWLVDPLQPIFPDSNDLSNYSANWATEFPSGTIADVHLVAELPLGNEYKISASLNGNGFKSNFYELIDVPVEQNTGLDSRTEIYTDQKNPYVIRRAPFRIYEAIKPLKENRFFAKNKFTALRLEIPENLIEEINNYSVEIKIEGENFSKTCTFNFKVYPAKIPNINNSNFFYTNWFNLQQMESFHNVERWSDKWFEILNKYAQLMAHGRQNSITIPNEVFQIKDDELTLDENKLLKFINVFRKYGFKYFEAPHLMYRGDEDNWEDPELKVLLTKKRYYNENGSDDIETLVYLIKNFAQENDLTNNWLQHISDEPTGANAKCYKDVVAQVKSIFPEAKIMEATNDRDSIAGAIDIWCPLINDFQENESFFREREKYGEKVLVYTCLIPGGPWLNRTLDMERIRQVYFGWAAAFYNTSGYLHWGLNQYCANPYEQSVVKHPSPIAGPTNYLPAGDTHIIYPGEDGPLSSVRFEAHRIGCEDYELLQMLKIKNKILYDKLVNRLFQNYTSYNKDLNIYRDVRKELLNSLE